MDRLRDAKKSIELIKSRLFSVSDSVQVSLIKKSNDGENVYYRGELIKVVDGQTFDILDSPDFFYFAIDKNNVYKHDKIFEDADPLTFYYDPADERTVVRNHETKYVIGDKYNKWIYTPPNSIKKVENK